MPVCALHEMNTPVSKRDKDTTNTFFIYKAKNRCNLIHWKIFRHPKTIGFNEMKENRDLNR